MSYEFTADEEDVIAGVGNLSLILGILIIIGGIMDFFIAQNQFSIEWSDGITAELIVFIAIVLAQLVIGGVIFLPAQNLRLIKKTKGNDVEELMNGMNKLLIMTKVIIGGLITCIILLLISFGMEAN
jgi:hypothetical protein